MQSPSARAAHGMQQRYREEQAYTLCKAAYCGETEELAKLLSQTPAPNPNHHDSNKRLPLVLAAEQGQTEAVEMLLEAGADINAADKDDNGYTPLMAAMISWKSETVDLLMRHKPSLDRKTKKDFTIMHAAAMGGYIEIMRSMLAQRFDCDPHTKDKVTPLLQAVANGQGDAGKLLLAHAADPHVITAEGASVLAWAVFGGNKELILELLKRGCNPNTVDKNGKSAAHIAVEENNLAALKLLIDHGADWTPTLDTMLTTAVRHADTELLNVVWPKGHDANYRDADGVPLLLHAACYGNSDAVAFLLQHGADPGMVRIVSTLKNDGSVEEDKESALASVPSTAEKKKITALVKRYLGLEASTSDNASRPAEVQRAAISFSARNNRSDKPGEDDKEERYLYQPGTTALHLAIAGNKETIVQLLLDHGAPVEALDMAGHSPLFVAINLERSFDMVDMLLKKGANPNMAELDSRPLLNNAAAGGEIKIFNALLENGADPDTTNYMGTTPMHLAAKYGSIEVAQCMLERGVSMHENSSGVTPLRMAVMHGQHGVVPLLVDYGAKLDERHPVDGRTVLHDVALGDDEIAAELIKTAEKLIGMGLSPFVKDNEGRTPLHAAAQRGNVQMIMLFLKHASAADIDAEDNRGVTVVAAAEANGHFRAVKLLQEKRAQLGKDLMFFQ